MLKGVSGAATALIGDEIFIIGGFNVESEEPNGDVQIFNVETGKCRISEQLRLECWREDKRGSERRTDQWISDGGSGVARFRSRNE